MIQKRQDYFLLHPPRQPKREVCQYIYNELKGLSFGGMRLSSAKIYDDFADAARAFNHPKSKIDMIIRTEDRQDYYGASGLRDSPCSAYMEDRSSFLRYFHMGDEKAIMKIKANTESRIIRYCSHAGISQEDFDRDFSLSYWKYVQGVPITITADSAIAGKYHVFLSRGRNTSYATVEDGKVCFMVRNGLPQFALNALPATPAFYEEIRNLDRFSSGHCYITEGVLGEKHFTPLQMLVGRDFEPATFSLGGKMTPGIHAVRGATKNEDGIICTTPVYYEMESYKPTGIEDALFFSSCDPSIIEAYARKIKVFFIEPDYNRHNDWHAAHLTVSEMFKPEISIVLDNPFGNSVDDKSEMASIIRESRRTGKTIMAHFRIVADGHTAIAERV